MRGRRRTVVHLLDHVFDFLRGLDVGDNDARRAGVEGGGERELIALGDTNNHEGAAFGMGLRCMYGALCRQKGTFLKI